MINRSSLSDSAQIRLMEIIADLRSRWRMKVALRGLAIVAAAGVFALLISAVGLERFGFTPAAVVAFRVLTYLTIVALAVQYLFRPLMRKVTDDTIALYLEEHEPSLEATVLSALSVGDPEKNTHISRALALRTIEDAVARCHAIDDGRRIDQRAIARFSTALGGAAILGAGVIFLSPGFLRHGARAILNPFGSVASANPYSIEVDPGNVTIPRGADQPITAALHGFDATQADIVMQRGGDSLFTRLPMNVTDSARFDLLLFALDRDTEYYIESNGIRSQVYRITVADIPYVDGLTLEYHFPAYTGLSPQVIENGGDIAVLRGTTVRVFASTTLPVPGGRIVRENGDTIRMTVDSTGALVGDMKVDANGFYHIELEGPNVQPSSSSPQYTIEVLDDLPPIVRFTKPGRDTRASAVEEVFVEATAEDDYGVSKLEILYSVNGGEEQSITLMDSNRSLKEAIAGHTFYLEELDLQPGDLVSYYARATDNNAAGQRKSASSDIYFMTIRPFNLDYTQADQAGGGGGGGGGGQQQNGELSDQQREIVAATFNVLRDSASITTKELEENLVTIALAQEDLEAQAQTLAERMNNRGITNDSSFNAIAELLPQAAEHMDAATAALRDGRPTDALPEEQKALQFLLRAEAIYEEVQIQFQQQQQGGGGGGGGGNSPNAEDLADLFELELDKLRNQYETVQRGEQQQQQGAQSDQVDETLERLRELARRQQQENERMRQLSRAGGSTGGQSSQRDLAQETEEAARQLERLAREQQRPELQDAARRLREAADAMRRSAANARSGNTADGQNALDELEEATRRLQRNQQQALSEQARSALERANQMAREQDDIGERMDQLGNMSGSERAEAARRLVEEKEQQDAEINELQRDLSQMASAANRENPQAARELREAANSIIENRVSEKIRYSRVQTTPGTNREYARALEEEIGANIDEVRQGISDAVDSFEQSARGDQAEESLEEARNLARSLESLEERTRAAQEGDQRRLGQQGEGQQGQQSQQGQQGDQQGQQGDQQGQQGQGQQGQQGQGQQGQQGQGQQGQQGQGQQGQQGQGQQGQQGQGQQGQQGQGQQGGQQQGQGQQGQGQGQRQGGQQQEGGTGGEQQEGGVTRGMPNGPGGAADNRPPRGLSSDQIRQFRGEARQRLDEARQLREELAREGFDVSDLDQVIMDLSRLDDERVYGTPKELALLQAAIVDGVKQFEYRLRRELAGSAEDRLLLGGSREVPEGFRELVEEYYKTLSRREGGR